MIQLTLASSRKTIRLGSELGRGGEGTVFSINENKNHVAKIYSVNLDQRKIKKLILMAETGDASLLKSTAWPIDLLVDQRQTVKGFLMPRIDARRDIHELYSPKSRSEAFPTADFKFLVHVGANIARAFAVLHEKGYVLGDVNHGNLLVGPDGTVRLIDCDSFQIGNGLDVFTCDVGTPLFTPPELQGVSLRGRERTANHDGFGLAVLLFHLLFLGRHPFAGRFSGPGEMPIEKAITENRFAYGADRSKHGMERPPGTVPLEFLDSSIAKLFTSAFSRLSNTGTRPEAKAWIAALEKLERSLRACTVANWHQYPNGLSTCPWCTIETQTGLRLFGQKILFDLPTETTDLSKLWEAIIRVPKPAPAPSLPSEHAWQPPSTFKKPSILLKIIRKIISAGLAFGGLTACNALRGDEGLIWAILFYILAYLIWPRISPEKSIMVEQAYSTAKKEWYAVLKRWNGEALSILFENKKKELEKALSDIKNLPNEKQKRLKILDSQRESRQRQLYLDRFRIDRARIPRIGPSRTAMLAAYGIETAADIAKQKILQIPGFGNTIASELLQWLSTHNRNFRFNPAIPVDQRDIASIDQDLETQKRALLTKLNDGPYALKQLNQNITTARARLLPIMESTWNKFQMAEIERDSL